MFFAHEVWCIVGADSESDRVIDRNVNYTPNLTGKNQTTSTFVDQIPYSVAFAWYKVDVGQLIHTVMDQK